MPTGWIPSETASAAAAAQKPAVLTEAGRPVFAAYCVTSPFSCVSGYSGPMATLISGSIMAGETA